MTDKAKFGISSSLWFGVVIWLAFCILAVSIRGVRWEETYERAQVLLGQVAYPAGHPLFRYAHNAFTIQYHVSAALLWLTQSAAVVCGMRDTLALAATVLPVFLLASLISGRTLFGHVAAVFAVAGTLKPFGSFYPIFTWPDKFTSGHIGMGVVLITLFLLVAQHWRAGGLLLGLLPCIHIGQMPVLIPFAGILLGYLWTHERKPEATACVKWAGGGLIISGIVWGLLKATSIPAPVTGGYASTADAHELWQRYTFVEDVHRAFPKFSPAGHVVIILAGMLLIGGIATYLELRRSRKPGPVTWLTLYSLLIALTVATVAAAHHILGDNTPFALISWMPYRLPNQVAVILLATTVALCVKNDLSASTTGRNLIIAALLYLTLRPLLAFLVSEATATRYLYASEGILFLLAGAASVNLIAAATRRRVLVVALFAAGLGALAAYHQFGAACAGLGLVAYFVKLSHTSHTSHSSLSIVAALCVTALTPLLVAQWQTREHLPIGEFERAVTATLAERGDADAMIVAPHWSIDLQEKIGHPILYTYETPQFVTYMPSLAPTIEKIQNDVYDIRFAHPWDYRLEAWQKRPREEWQRLSNEFGFKYVIAPKAVRLSLTPLVEGISRTLYAVK